MLPRAGPSGKEAASQQARTWLLPDAASCRHLAFATPLAGEPASSTYAHRRGPSSVVTRAFVAALGWSDRQGRLVRLRSARRQRPCGCPRSSPPDSRRTVSASVLLAGPRFSSGTTGPRAAMETPSHAARPRSATRTGCVAGPVVRRTRTWWCAERRDRPNETLRTRPLFVRTLQDQNVAARSASAERRRINSSPTPRSSEGAGAGGCR